MSEHKLIVLCADDFGLSADVSQGIIKLAGLQRISAVGCMANMPDFIVYAQDLRAIHHKVQLGLHFNLTEGYFVSDPQRSCFAFNEILFKSHLGVLHSSVLAKELNAQLDKFIELMGSMPDFIDGHQHIHQFPKIRAAVFTLYEQRLKTHRVWIRSTYPAITLPKYWFKGMILAKTGGKTFSAELKRRNIPHNVFFSGVYDFDRHSNYRTLFKQWLASVPSNTLIMCHPGEGFMNTDSIAYTRLAEFDYLLSDDFLADCEQYGVTLATGPGFRH